MVHTERLVLVESERLCRSHCIFDLSAIEISSGKPFVIFD